MKSSVNPYSSSAVSQPPRVLSFQHYFQAGPLLPDVEIIVIIYSLVLSREQGMSTGGSIVSLACTITIMAVTVVAALRTMKITLMLIIIFTIVCCRNSKSKTRSRVLNS